VTSLYDGANSDRSNASVYGLCYVRNATLANGHCSSRRAKKRALRHIYVS